jgi:hypothetical protein
MRPSPLPLSPAHTPPPPIQLANQMSPHDLGRSREREHLREEEVVRADETCPTHYQKDKGREGKGRKE